MRGKHRFWVLGILALAALATVVSGVPEPPAGRRDLSYYVWYPGQAISALVTPPVADAGRLNAYAQLPVAFFVNVLLYAAALMGCIQAARRAFERLSRRL